jgi:hypothetical protein
VRFTSGEEYWDLFVSSYGPTRMLAENLDDDRREDLHRSWVDFMEANFRRDGEVVHDREWLLVLGTRR